MQAKSFDKASYEKLTKNLQKRMRLLGLTQKALALKSGLNETAVRDILKGRSTDPQFSTLRGIARTLGCAIEDLYKEPPRGKATFGFADGRNTWPDDVGLEAMTFLNDIDSPNVLIEEIETAGVTVGAAALSDGRSKRVSGTWDMPPEILAGRFNGDRSTLKIIRIDGDSMAPDFRPGDRVLVDTSVTRISPAGIFLLWDGVGFVVRRCEIKPKSRPPRVFVRALNDQYSSYESSLKDLDICGRVIGKWQNI